MLIHEIVRTERLAQGISLSRLARLAEVDDGNLSKFERGLAWMREDSLQRVLNVLGLKLVRIPDQVPSESLDRDPIPLPDDAHDFENAVTDRVA